MRAEYLRAADGRYSASRKADHQSSKRPSPTESKEEKGYEPSVYVRFKR